MNKGSARPERAADELHDGCSCKVFRMPSIVRLGKSGCSATTAVAADRTADEARAETWDRTYSKICLRDVFLQLLSHSDWSYKRGYL